MQTYDELVERLAQLHRVSAIQPSAPMRVSYHVTVAVPKLAEGHGCMVGRPGRVSFNDGPRRP
jgi:hypothetical protein